MVVTMHTSSQIQDQNEVYLQAELKRIKTHYEKKMELELQSKQYILEDAALQAKELLQKAQVESAFIRENAESYAADLLRKADFSNTTSNFWWNIALLEFSIIIATVGLVVTCR
jgi:hypothetical protein